MDPSVELAGLQTSQVCPRHFFFCASPTFSGVDFQIPRRLHLLHPKNQRPISEIKGDYTAHQSFRTSVAVVSM